MTPEINALSEKQVDEIRKIAKQCKDMEQGGVLGVLIPLVLLVAVPMAIWVLKRRNHLLKTPEIAKAIESINSLEKKKLQSIAKENSIAGAVCQLQIERHTPYAPIVVLALFLVLFAVVFVL